MPNEKQNPELEAEPAAPTGEPTTPENGGVGDPQEPSQNANPKPHKSATPHSKRERLLHARNKIDKELDELQGVENDDDQPMTRGDYRRMQEAQAQNTAIDMANAIEDETERAEVVDLLNNRIAPSGDAKKDFELALTAVNGKRNAEIAQEVARRTTPSAHAAAPGAPAAPQSAAFQPTAEERVMMQNYGLTEDDVRKARQKSQQTA